MGTNPPPVPGNASKVSAHELLIPQKARQAFDKGTKLLAAKDSAASIVEFQSAIKAFPDFYEAYYKIGLADLNLKSYPDAQAAFETSIELSKGRYPPSQFGLGGAALAFGWFVYAVWTGGTPGATANLRVTGVKTALTI